MKCYEREDLVMDIGLHRGEDSAYYLKKGFKVVAVEADPDLISHCKSRFPEFIESGNLTIVEGAVSDVGPDVEEIVFYKYPTLSLWGTINQDWQDTVTNENVKFMLGIMYKFLENYGGLEGIMQGEEYEKFLKQIPKLEKDSKSD